MQLQTRSEQKYPSLDWNWQGYSIRYSVFGEGQPLLLIHGFGASIGHWRKNIGVLAEAGYRVFAIDLLGFGGSSKPPLAYSLTLWQEQLKAFLDEKIQAPTVFVGNSIGGLLSLLMTMSCRLFSRLASSAESLIFDSFSSSSIVAFEPLKSNRFASSLRAWLMALSSS
jgi:pimeloyl-ACP methyl ester carboxylesterase